MALSTLTVLLAAALGGAVAVDVTALIVVAVAGLTALAMVNGLRALAVLTDDERRPPLR